MTSQELISECLKYSFNRSCWRDSLLPDTFKWFNAAGSLLIAANRGDPNCLGGIRPGEAPGYRKTLELWWSIKDHDTALEKMNDLIDSGMREKFECTMLIFKEYRRQVKIIKSSRKKTNSEILNQRYEKYGSDAILGWDLCRAIIITNWCHICGYLSFEEMMEISITAGKMLQNKFSSWDEVMESYMCGYFYWVNPHSYEEKRDYKLRRHIYRTLKGRKGPFASIDFLTSLSSCLSDKEKEKLNIISK